MDVREYGLDEAIVDSPPISVRGTVLDDEIIGFPFTGKEVDLEKNVDRIRRDSKVLFVTEATDKCKAISFLRDHGFNNVLQVREPELPGLINSTDAELVIFDKASVQERNDALLVQYDIKWQLYGMIKLYISSLLTGVNKAYQLLEDDGLSKEAYLISVSVRYKILSPENLFKVYDMNQYFAVPEVCRFDYGDVFVDCGAFTGDVVEKYINMCQGVFSEVYAFEPGNRQYKALKSRCRRLKEEWALSEAAIHCIKAGTGSKNSVAFIETAEKNIPLQQLQVIENGTSADEKIDVIALDDFFAEKKIHFLKADIEGAEMEMLLGAANVIKRDNPRVLISLYHRLTDYYEIPLFLKKLVPEYKFKVRHHSTIFPETVLYAYT